jgi:hypothetical protein
MAGANAPPAPPMQVTTTTQTQQVSYTQPQRNFNQGYDDYQPQVTQGFGGKLAPPPQQHPVI